MSATSASLEGDVYTRKLFGGDRAMFPQTENFLIPLARSRIPPGQRAAW
jgi:hypothetical protein